MSYYSEQFNERENINRFLKELGTEKRLSSKHIELLEEYQNLGANPESLELRACAQIAVNELNDGKYRGELLLNEYGVSFHQGLATEFDTPQERQDAEKQFGEKIAGANEDFLDKWVEVRERRKQQKRNLDEIRAIINANADLFVTPKKVAEALQENGFTLSDPQSIQITPIDALANGVEVVATKQTKDGLERVEFNYFPSEKNPYYTHVDHSKGIGKECQQLHERVSDIINTVIQNESKSCGAPAFLQTASSGLGKGNKTMGTTKEKPVEDILEVSQQQILSQ